MQDINLEETRGEINCITPGHPHIHHNTVENEDVRSFGKLAGLMCSGNHVRKRSEFNHVHHKPLIGVSLRKTLRYAAEQPPDRSD